MRKFPGESERVESGAIQFGDDWPGLWLRGDDAFGVSLDIATVLQHVKANSEKIPLDLYLAMLSLARIADEIQTDVTVGGAIAPLLTPLIQKGQST